MKALLLLPFLFVSEVQAISCNPHPELHITSNHNKSNQLINTGISQSDWDSVLDKIESIYVPYLQPAGIEFKVTRKWDDPTVNAHPRREGNVWTIDMYGGYAQAASATKDALAMLACHEVAHHLGGGAFFYPTPYEWASAEGQSDYWASLKCLRTYFQDEDNIKELEGKTFPESLSEACKASWEDPQDQAICIRSSLAGFDMNMVWTNGVGGFSFDTKDPLVVSETQVYHPDFQCRVDTIVEGSLCTVDKEIRTIDKDADTGMCNVRDGHKTGLRPKCWYSYL